MRTIVLPGLRVTNASPELALNHTRVRSAARAAVGLPRRPQVLRPPCPHGKLFAQAITGVTSAPPRHGEYAPSLLVVDTRPGETNGWSRRVCLCDCDPLRCGKTRTWMPHARWRWKLWPCKALREGVLVGVVGLFCVQMIDEVRLFLAMRGRALTTAGGARSKDRAQLRAPRRHRTAAADLRTGALQ